MKSNNLKAAIGVVAATVLSLAGCSSASDEDEPVEMDEMEEAAEAHADAIDNQAEAVEDIGEAVEAEAEFEASPGDDDEPTEIGPIAD